MKKFIILILTLVTTFFCSFQTNADPMQPIRGTETASLIRYATDMSTMPRAKSQVKFKYLSSKPNYSLDGRFTGFFTIPSVGIDIPLYQCYGDWTYTYGIAQSYTDKQNSAAIAYDYGLENNYYIITDHVDQGFATLHQVGVGSTAFINWKNGGYTNMYCIDAGVGVEMDGYLFDQYGNNWHWWVCDAVAYTCVPGTANGYFITKWNFQ